MDKCKQIKWIEIYGFIKMFIIILLQILKYFFKFI